MIGTRLDEADDPRLVPSERGWWFIGNGTWTLLKPGQVGPDGKISPDAERFLREHGAYQPRQIHTFSLTVLTSTACNLGCGYCFQNTALDPRGGHRPLRIESRRLHAGTIDRIVDFTRDRMAQAGLTKLYLLLFGGEPLLNPRGCLQLLERTASFDRRRTSMTTNGVLLTPALASELNSAGLRHVQITFDGSRVDHDQIRVHHSGGATFDTIVANVGNATAVTDLRWKFRVNVSHRNADRIGELFGQLTGRVDPARCMISFSWVGDAGFGYGNELRHDRARADALVAWSTAALEAGFSVPRPSMRTTCPICSVPGGRHGAVVNADGTLYSCWQSAGKPGWEVGTVDSGYLDVACVPERWTTCGYEYKQADSAQVEAFQDRADGQLLDYLYATGRLPNGAAR